LTPLYAYIPILYPESLEQKISIAEVFGSLGFLLGPIIGSLLYQLGGYITPFLFFGCVALLPVPLIGCYLAQQRKAQVKEANVDNETD
jgi:MFS family permease